jgi:quercetin dioxygenase-like cupin family protein
MSDGELGMTVRVHQGGTASEAQLLEITVEADAATQPHAHDEAEIMFVLDGEMHLGASVVTAGSSAYIPANTMYTLRAGSKGLRFLNFRGRQDLSYITRSEFVARRRTQRQ